MQKMPEVVSFCLLTRFVVDNLSFVWLRHFPAFSWFKLGYATVSHNGRLDCSNSLLAGIADVHLMV